MPFTPEEIVSKRFLPRARGYDRDEVHAFLRAVAADYRAALDAASALVRAAEQAAEAEAPVAPIAPVTPDGYVIERRAADRRALERRAVQLLAHATRRLEEVTARERRVTEAEQRLAAQLESARFALRGARKELTRAQVMREQPSVAVVAAR